MPVTEKKTVEQVEHWVNSAQQGSILTYIANAKGAWTGPLRDVALFARALEEAGLVLLTQKRVHGGGRWPGSFDYRMHRTRKGVTKQALDKVKTALWQGGY